MDLIVKTGRLRAPKYLICAELIYICFMQLQSIGASISVSVLLKNIQD